MGLRTFLSMIRTATLLMFLGLLFTGCGSESPTAPIEPADLFAQLLLPPTAEEISSISVEFSQSPGRNPTSTLDTLDTRSGTFSNLSLVAYRVDDLQIYGIISTPKLPGTYPLILYNHGGDSGLRTEELEQPLALGFVLVASSFRSEAVHWFGVDYTSDGTPDPWSGDVRDALILLDHAEDLVEADPTRVITVGVSRGGGVSLLAAAMRTGHFEKVIDVFGPTDFFDPAIWRDVDFLVSESLDPRPGADYLQREIVRPFLLGERTLSEARLALLRRSALYFADRLPPTQIHHGLDDQIVPISQSDRLVNHMNQIGQPVDYWPLSGQGHDIQLIIQQLPRILTFLQSPSG